MPARSAATMTVTPSSTSIRLPSISTVGMGARGCRLRAERTATERGVLLELGTELRDEGARRHRGAVGEGADGVALNVVGQLQQEVDVARGGPAVLETAEYPIEPASPLTAWRALAARLVVEELDQVVERPHHAHRVVHHHDAGGAEKGAGLLDRVHVHRHVDLCRRERR